MENMSFSKNINLDNLTESERAFYNSGYVSDFKGTNVYMCTEEYVVKLQNAIKELVGFVKEQGEYKSDNMLVLDEFLNLVHSTDEKEN